MNHAPSVSRALLVGFALLALMGPVSAANGGEGHGESYWGTIPAPTDSTATTMFEFENRPGWEPVLNTPFQIVAFPLRLVGEGLASTVGFLDDSGAVRKLGKLLGPQQAPFGFLVNFKLGGLAGAGGGITFRHDEFLGPQNRLRLGWDVTSRRNVRARFGLLIPGATEWQLGAGYRKRPNARFFGIGPGTAEDAESFYTREVAWAGISAKRTTAGNFAVEGRAMWTAADAGPPRDDRDNDPSILETFDGALPPGFGQRTDGVELSLGLIHESVGEDGRPDRGGFRLLRGAYFIDTNNDAVRLWTVRGEVQQFVPLWHTKRALALRGFISWIENSQDAPVPFQRLMTNDDPDLLRGYKDFRWQDQGMTVVSAEYRWPIWANRTIEHTGVDAYLLADVGQVFGDSSELALDNLTFSYGGGVRLIGFRNFLGRLEIARSDEETVVRLRADQIFQFTKGDLLHGRNPIPVR